MLWLCSLFFFSKNIKLRHVLHACVQFLKKHSKVSIQTPNPHSGTPLSSHSTHRWAIRFMPSLAVRNAVNSTMENQRWSSKSFSSDDLGTRWCKTKTCWKSILNHVNKSSILQVTALTTCKELKLQMNRLYSATRLRIRCYFQLK